MSITDTSPVPIEPEDTIDADAVVVLPGLDHDAEAIYVAPNWKLVWWRFKKHRLALISGVIIIFIATIALFPDFYSTLPPHESDSIRSFVPPQRLRFFGEDGSFLYVYDVIGQRNPETLMMEWVADETTIVPVKLLARGYDYEIFGLISTNIHLLGVENPDSGEKFHLLGTDRLGRDQWSRLMAGTRVSLSIGLVAVIISIFLGVLLGGISERQQSVEALRNRINISWLRSLIEDDDQDEMQRVAQEIATSFAMARETRQTVRQLTAPSEPIGGRVAEMYSIIHEQQAVDLKDLVLQMMAQLNDRSQALEVSLDSLADLFRRNCIHITVKRRRR